MGVYNYFDDTLRKPAMRNDILGKLSILLRDPIKQESSVVYLMVEMRKLIEIKKRELGENRQVQYYPGILFYSNWCVHTELDGRVAQEHLKHIEALTKRGEIKDEFLVF